MPAVPIICPAADCAISISDIDFIPLATPAAADGKAPNAAIFPVDAANPIEPTAPIIETPVDIYACVRAAL